ncbi:glycosyltransferase family 2 protein [Gammaproteobacteria bacterium]|nr:glycosyltransferase family 2 protein [Gammaproteobacteria bacterium]
MNPRFSIVVPTLDNVDDLKKLIISVNSQTLLPREIVVADSSSSNDIQEISQSISSIVPIVYLRVGRAYPYDRLLRYISSLSIFLKAQTKYPAGRAFPYEATNAGVRKASFEWVAFLDATTIPINSWLEDYWHLLCLHECDVVFGNTTYCAETKFQKILRASTYGRIGHETAPGSIITKANFLDGHEIMEGVRSGGDVAWRNDLKESFRYFIPSKPYLKYSNLSKKILPALKKLFIYQIYGSLLDIQHNIKDLYLGLALMLGIIITPKWNYIVGWDSPLFIPHITKVFFISILLISASSFIVNRAVLRRFTSDSPSINFFKIAIFIMTSYSIYNWNAVVAQWVEDSIWYFPHITKIYIFSIILASFAYRGIYFPLKNKIELSYLFPLNWILVGALGIALDIVKAPGYLLGGMMASFVRRQK